MQNLRSYRALAALLLSLLVAQVLGQQAPQPKPAPAPARWSGLIGEYGPDDDVIVIPKSSNRERVQEDLGALDVRLTHEQIGELDAIFPPPKGPQSLAML